ncbi:MAG: hypothetical protein IJ150_06760 [Bacteroidales bacterium]|nr:hypothetical protein [Bacteroidales bacterium]
MKHIFLYFAVLLIFFSNCGNPVKKGYQKITSNDGKFSVVLPEGMKEIKGLNASASMQYGNLNSGISFMVIVDDLQQYKKIVDQNIDNFQVMECFDTTKNVDIYSLKGYEFLILQLSKSEADDFQPDNIMDDDTIINGLQARVCGYKEKIKGDKSFIVLCLYKGKDRLYQVYAMTSQKNMADNKQAMLEMVKSLEEI